MDSAGCDVQAVDQALATFVRPDTFPVAIRVARAGESLPPRVRRPLRDLGVHVSVCQAVSMARRYGWAVGVGGEDLNCPIAQVAFGFEEPHPYYTEGNLAHRMYVETCEAGARTEAEVPRFSPQEAGVILLAPLARAEFTPETLLVYGNTAQVMRLAVAALWKEGGALTSTVTGRADCADIVIRTAQAGRPQVILPCNGDRVFGQTQDHEMAFTIPWAQVPALLEGLEGTHKGGVRYPIPHFLRYEPAYPAHYEKLHQLWRQEKDGQRPQE